MACLIVLALILAFTIPTLRLPVASQSPPRSDPQTSPTVADFAFNVTDYQGDVTNETFSSYEAWLQSWNVSDATGYLYHQPTGFLFLQYCYQQACGGSTWHLMINVEVYEFANVTAALNEFTAQYRYRVAGTSCIAPCPPGWPGDTGPIFRFYRIFHSSSATYRAEYATQQVVQRSNFMFFFYSVGPSLTNLNYTGELRMWNFVNSYINDIFGVIPGDDAPSSPPANISASSPQWGLQVGDNITWNIKTSGCVGNVLSGGECSSSNDDVNIQVVAVADGGRAVEVKGPSQHGWPSDFGEGGDFNYYGGIHPGPLPTQSYTWINGSAPYMDPKGSGFPLLYPVFSEMQTLESSIKSTTVATDFTNSMTSVTGTYSTGSSSQGITPVETENEWVVVHIGSGVVTSITFYYNNNQNAISKSSTLSLKGTSFDLNSRPSPYQIITSSTTHSTSPTITTSTISTSSTTTRNTIPEFPYSSLAAVVLVAVVVVAYILVRESLGRSRE